MVRVVDSSVETCAIKEAVWYCLPTPKPSIRAGWEIQLTKRQRSPFPEFSQLLMQVTVKEGDGGFKGLCGAAAGAP